MKPFLKLVAVASLAATAATAQMTHDHSSSHVGHQPVDLSEPGQGAFAALSEVVALLRQSPDTDWERVGIKRLRDHLVDMDLLMMYAQAEETHLQDGLQIRISMMGEAGGAVSRMVPAHGPVLSAETGWRSHVVREGDALVWTVTSKEDASQIGALGFFGLMAVGDHHRAHHLGIVIGHGMH